MKQTVTATILIRRLYKTAKCTTQLSPPSALCAPELQPTSPKQAPPPRTHHDGTRYQIPCFVWPGWVSWPGCVPSWLLVKIKSVLPKPRMLSTPYSIPSVSCLDPPFSSESPPLFLSLIHTNRSHSLSLGIIPLKCPLTSFNPWLQAPSVFQGRRGDVWCWIVTLCIWSLRLMYLVRRVPMVCGLKMLFLMKLLGACCRSQVQSHHHCSLLGFIKVRPSLVWVIFTVILLIYNNYSSDNRQ